jgi:hypothetical protein
MGSPRTTVANSLLDFLVSLKCWLDRCLPADREPLVAGAMVGSKPRFFSPLQLDFSKQYPKMRKLGIPICWIWYNIIYIYICIYVNIDMHNIYTYLLKICFFMWDVHDWLRLQRRPLHPSVNNPKKVRRGSINITLSEIQVPSNFMGGIPQIQTHTRTHTCLKHNSVWGNHCGWSSFVNALLPCGCHLKTHSFNRSNLRRRDNTKPR